MNLKPMTLKAANEFVSQHHRHNTSTQGHKFSVGLEDNGTLIGVAIVGRPLSRVLDDGYTAEILRVCVLNSYPNANSTLYGAALRACCAMGYRRVITYTLPVESGSSLKAVGFKVDGVTQARKDGWNTPARPRTMSESYPAGQKIRWIREFCRREVESK